MNWQSNVKGTKRLQYYHDCFDNVFTEKNDLEQSQRKKIDKKCKKIIWPQPRENGSFSGGSFSLATALFKGETSSSHCIHNWPVTREIRNSGSFKFRRVEPARYLHNALRPLLNFVPCLPGLGQFSRVKCKWFESFFPPPLVVVEVAYPHYLAYLLFWQSRFPPIT